MNALLVGSLELSGFVVPYIYALEEALDLHGFRGSETLYPKPLNPNTNL